MPTHNWYYIIRIAPAATAVLMGHPALMAAPGLPDFGRLGRRHERRRSTRRSSRRAGYAVMARLKEHSHAHAFTHLAYESVDHGITSYYWPTTLPKNAGGYSVDGTVEGDAHAQADFWPMVLRFLGQSLRTGREGDWA